MTYTIRELQCSAARECPLKLDGARLKEIRESSFGAQFLPDTGVRGDALINKITRMLITRLVEGVKL